MTDLASLEKFIHSIKPSRLTATQISNEYRTQTGVDFVPKSLGRYLILLRKKGVLNSRLLNGYNLHTYADPQPEPETPPAPEEYKPDEKYLELQSQNDDLQNKIDSYEELTNKIYSELNQAHETLVKLEDYLTVLMKV
jgi:hypothetical protein